MTAFQLEYVEYFRFDSRGRRVSDLPENERREYWQRNGQITSEGEPEGVTDPCG